MSVPKLSVNNSAEANVQTADIEPRRVLSIQSHVVSGYVGNKAATFPLQLLGWDVDVVNTVQFSNHTGYGHTAGTRTTADDLNSIFEGLKSNGLLKAARLLTGYIPGGEAVEAVGEIARYIKAERKGTFGGDLVYVLDPVMGDHGTLYVAESVIPIYRDLLSLATIITPNQFEAETLADMKITSLMSLHALLTHLHSTYDLPHIIITSFSLPSSTPLPTLPPPPKAYLDRLASAPDAKAWEAYPRLLSVASSSTPSGLQTTLTQFPEVPGYFSGVGDLFSALTCAHYLPSSETCSTLPSRVPSPTPGAKPLSDLSIAAGRALLTTQQILLSTHLKATASTRPTDDGGEGDSSDEEADESDRKRRVKRMRKRELNLIGRRGRGDIESGGVWPGAEVDLLHC